MELLDKNGLTEEQFLSTYRADRYPRPSMTADIVLLSPEEPAPKVLLIRRGGHPCLGCWALPGGFANPSESVDEAARRELAEETHVEGLPLRQLMRCSAPGRDPRGWTISQVYLSVADRFKLAVRADDDAAAAAWFAAEYRLEGDRAVLALSNGQIRMEALLRVNRAETACGTVYDLSVLETGGIAFDHAAMILRGLLEMDAIGK